MWAHTNDDIIVISERWLNKSINDNVISIDGYNINRADRLKRGGGVVVYSKCKFHTEVLVKKSIPNQFEILALQIELSKGCYITVVGRYRPPSAAKETLSSLSNILSKLSDSEIAFCGDLNWDWQSPASDEFKTYCNLMNLHS